MKFRKPNLFYLIFSFLGGLLLLFVLLPLLHTMLSQSPSALIEVARDKEVLEAIFNSVSLAILTAILASVLGVPLAYLLARKQFRFKSVVESIVDLPLAVPHTVAGIALLFVFGRASFIGQLLNIDLIGTRMAIVLAMLFVSLPYLVNSAREGFEAVDERLEKVARSLGSSPFDTFWRVSFPLAKQSILVGLLLTWARAISEFGAVVIVAYYPMTAPVKIFDAFTTQGLKHSSAIAALLLLVCLGGFILFRLFCHGGHGGHGKK